jgi:p24 family protein delta-1
MLNRPGSCFLSPSLTLLLPQTKTNNHCSAHLIALKLPNEDEVRGDTALEKWYVDQVYAITKLKEERKILPSHLPAEPPDDVAAKMSSYLQTLHGEIGLLQIEITGTPASDPKSYQHHFNVPKYFEPIVVNYVGRITDAQLGRDRHAHRGEGNLEGYGVCFANRDAAKQVQVVFDVVFLNEEVLDLHDADAAARNKGGFDKDEHLTPLERSLDQSISAAHSVLLEMQYMEKREQRMRKTADSINGRVRWFSYLSVSVLLSVTYIQVSYLKRYFHKKKLM